MRDSRELYFYVGFLIALPAFAWTWWQCIDQYGLLIGASLGWLPATVISAGVMVAWPVAIAIFSISLLTNPSNSIFLNRAADMAVWELLWVGLLVVMGLIGGLIQLVVWSENRLGFVSRRRGLAITLAPAALIVSLYVVYLAMQISGTGGM